MACVNDGKEVLYLRVPVSLKRKLHMAAARRGISITATAIDLLANALQFDELADRVVGTPDPIDPIA